MISKTDRAPGHEPLMRSNKSPLAEVKLLHKKEHWLTKAKDNYERNYISENIGRGLRLGPRHSGGSNFNDGYDKRCCDWDRRNRDDYDRETVIAAVGS